MSKPYDAAFRPANIPMSTVKPCLHDPLGWHPERECNCPTAPDVAITMPGINSLLQQHKESPNDHIGAAPARAVEFLRKASSLLEERGKQYDQPSGERSMGRTVAAFNTITNRSGDRALSESDGWLLMQTLKDVRQWQTPGKFHRDSAEDCVSYAALKAESLARQ